MSINIGQREAKTPALPWTFGKTERRMTAIEIDCYSLNFTNESHDVFDPWTQTNVRGPKILPMTCEQQNSTLAIIENYSVELHEETAQLCLSIDGGYVYIDASLRVDRKSVHFKVAIVPVPNYGIAQFVFDFAVASQMALVAPGIDIIIAVPTTPINRVPSHWPTAKLCLSPHQVHELLDSAFTSQVTKLNRLKNQWRGAGF